MALSDNHRKQLLEAPTGRVRVVMDTDTFNEIDDQFAIVQMMLSPEKLDVEAIYAAPFLNKRADSPGHGMELSYEEIFRILDRIGKKRDGFVFRGVTDYVGFEKQPREAPAVHHMIERARAGSPENPLYIIAIGAISNVASALLLAPDIIDRTVVVWLGGNALDWPRSFRQNAEFNLKQDVGGAQVLFDCGVPVVLVPAMGVTSHLHSTVPEIERHVEPHGSIGAFLAMRFKEYSTDHVGWSKPIWDMAAVAWLLDPEWTPSYLTPTPILTDDIAWQTDPTRHPMRYVRHVDRDAILKDFFAKLAAFVASRV
jgi:inosine-uridine nucleoside N-ribohydrolase